VAKLKIAPYKTMSKNYQFKEKKKNQAYWMKKRYFLPPNLLALGHFQLHDCICALLNK